MKKNIKISIMLIVSLFCILCLTSCGNLFADRGTAPTLLNVFYTDNNAPDNYDDWSQLPNRNYSIVQNTPYCLVCAFSDPDKNVNKLYLSVNSSFPDNTSQTWVYNINQQYESQISCWKGDKWQSSSSSIILYARVEDDAGNKSGTKAFTIYFNN